MSDPYTFTDGKSRTWNTKLTLAAAMRVDASDFTEVYPEKFSILSPDKELFPNLITNVPLMFAVIWAIVRPQAESQGISPKEDEAQAEFLAGIDGPTIKAGREAFWRSLTDFFPDMGTVLSTLKGRYDKMHNRMSLEIKGMEAEVDQMLDQEMDRATAKLKADLQKMRENPIGVS